MKTKNYTACEFKAATNVGAFCVSGYFVDCAGLAVVLHGPYGAFKYDRDGNVTGCGDMFASEYSTGILIAQDSRAKVLDRVYEYIALRGGVELCKLHLKKKQEPRNSLLITADYHIS